MKFDSVQKCQKDLLPDYHDLLCSFRLQALDLQHSSLEAIQQELAKLTTNPNSGRHLQHSSHRHSPSTIHAKPSDAMSYTYPLSNFMKASETFPADKNAARNSEGSPKGASSVGVQGMSPPRKTGRGSTSPKSSPFSSPPRGNALKSPSSPKVSRSKTSSDEHLDQRSPKSTVVFAKDKGSPPRRVTALSSVSSPTRDDTSFADTCDEDCNEEVMVEREPVPHIKLDHHIWAASNGVDECDVEVSLRHCNSFSFRVEFQVCANHVIPATLQLGQ